MKLYRLKLYTWLFIRTYYNCCIETVRRQETRVYWGFPRAMHSWSSSKSAQEVPEPITQVSQSPRFPHTIQSTVN
jgi:hypothetical protein